MGALTAAAAAGDRLTTLCALRDVLAESIEDADPDKRAPLAARLSDVLAQIEAAAEPEAEDGVDEIAQRRAARRERAAKGASRSRAGS